MVETCNRKKAGSPGILYSVNFWVMSLTVAQKWVNLGHDQNTWSNVPLSPRHLQQRSVVAG